MSTKRYKPEQVVNLLRQIEVETANGKTTPQACRDAQITVQTYYRWRKEFGGLKLDQAKRTDHPREVVEAALAHMVPNKVEAAYARSDLFERRRLLMDDWAAHLEESRGNDLSRC